MKTGSKTNTMNQQQVLATIHALKPESDFQWDGAHEDDRPATAEELIAGIREDAKRRGRPLGSGQKEQVAIRFDRDVLSALRATGKGWQTRVNQVMREWVAKQAH